jgi:SAM-dependent methyltransferase
MGARTVAKGLLSWIPGLHLQFVPHGSGTASAQYCYGVWLKHLTLLWAHGMREMPRSVLELGPGASVGTGLAALLSGARSYVGIDAVAYAQPATNSAVQRELIALFERRAPRPTAGFPPYDQYLDGRLFPSHILDEKRLAASLAPERLQGLERNVRYLTWRRASEVQERSIDLVFSHVVMNQVDDLRGTYRHCARWLRPGGWMSHQVDFTSLDTTPEWNGHRRYGELAWKLIAGRRAYFVNREVLSTHLELIHDAGLDIVHVIRGERQGGLTRKELAPRWRSCSKEDLRTQTGFVIARRPQA